MQVSCIFVDFDLHICGFSCIFVDFCCLCHGPNPNPNPNPNISLTQQINMSGGRNNSCYVPQIIFIVIFYFLILIKHTHLLFREFVLKIHAITKLGLGAVGHIYQILLFFGHLMLRD